MKIITSGLSYLDIDGYAACIAYAELLNLQGIAAIAASTAVMNNSVTNTIRSWDVNFVSDYNVDESDVFIVLDVSDPKNFDKLVNLDKVEEVVDHHVGFENYWKEKLGDKTEISFIGSVCTIIYERWLDSGLIDKMSPTGANLLISGILDNTLNFNASITDERDKIAYRELLKLSDLPDNWPEQYFNECQSSIFNDITGSIKKDIKFVNFKNLGTESIAVGQIVVWDGKKVLDEYINDIQKTMNGLSSEWLVNIASLDNGSSYFVCQSETVQGWAIKLFDVSFNGLVADAGRLWLRKEIIKHDSNWVE